MWGTGAHLASHWTRIRHYWRYAARCVWIPGGFQFAVTGGRLQTSAALLQDAEPLKPRFSTLHSMRESLVDLGANPLVSMSNQLLADQRQPMDSPLQDSHHKSVRSATGGRIFIGAKEEVYGQSAGLNAPCLLYTSPSPRD